MTVYSFGNNVVTIGGGAASSSSWQLASNHYLASFLSPQIIAPRAGLTTTNRYYLHYPGIPLRLPISILGGAWPFHYELSGAPSGMTIGNDLNWNQWNGTNPLGGTNTDYGIISWANPVAGTYNLTVTVTDQQGNTVNVSWTLTVQTSNFIFVDGVNGNASTSNGGTGTGTISNPFKTMNDWYAGATGGTGSGTRFDTTYTNYFVIYRGSTSGATVTYDMGTCYHDSNGIVEMQDKPPVHFAYPGESVTFDPQTSPSTWAFNGKSNVFLGEIAFAGAPNNAVGMTVMTGGQGTISNNVLTVTTAPTPANVGQACVVTGTSIPVGTYISSSGSGSGGTGTYNLANVHGTTIPNISTPEALTFSFGPNQIISNSGPATDTGIFECTFEEPSYGAIPGTNPALFFFGDNHPNVAQYISVIRNTYQGTNGYEIIEKYYTQYGVSEFNSLTNNTGSGFYLKLGTNDSWSYRGNIGLSGNSAPLVEMDDYTGTTNIELNYNRYISSIYGTRFGPNLGGTGIQNILLGRNSWSIEYHEVAAPVSNITITDDVCEFSSSTANTHGLNIDTNGSVANGTYSGEELVAHNGNFIDSNGNLLSGSLSYLGIRGAQIG